MSLKEYIQTKIIYNTPLGALGHITLIVGCCFIAYFFVLPIALIPLIPLILILIPFAIISGIMLALTSPFILIAYIVRRRRKLPQESMKPDLMPQEKGR